MICVKDVVNDDRSNIEEDRANTVWMGFEGFSYKQAIEKYPWIWSSDRLHHLRLCCSGVWLPCCPNMWPKNIIQRAISLSVGELFAKVRFWRVLEVIPELCQKRLRECLALGRAIRQICGKLYDPLHQIRFVVDRFAPDAFQGDVLEGSEIPYFHCSQLVE